MTVALFFSKSIPLKILFVASEVSPFVKVGGLGEVLFSLPRALQVSGCDVRAMLPKYLGIDAEKFPMKMEMEALEVPSGGEKPIICNVKSFSPDLREKDAPVLTYFLENQEYYEQRANVYGYADDAVRWALLCRGTVEFLKYNKEWRPDIIVASDWQTGLIPNFLKKDYKEDPVLSKITAVFSIHNLFYQGMFDHHFVAEMDYDDGQSAIPAFSDERLLKLNFMRRGIMYADAINTVSPTYAKEITTPEYGELLDGLLSERRSRLFGILNGIDYSTYNSLTDPLVEFKYGPDNLEERAKNKQVLRQKFNLPQADNQFILGIVSRLSEQKGFELLMKTLEPLLENIDFQLILVGSGDSEYMSFFQAMAQKYPERVAAHLSFDNILPKFIFAGADAILIPSKFEPSGLVQMESMRYGLVPIVRKTGGLADTVKDYNPISRKGTGFVFEKFEPFAFYTAVIRAWQMYKHPKIWSSIQKQAMKEDFSWEKSAKEYLRLFKEALRFRKEE